MSFEEDLEYANKILLVRTMMEERELHSHSGFVVHSISKDIFEYNIHNGHTLMTIGYHEKRQGVKHLNFHGRGLLIYNNSKNGRMQISLDSTIYRYSTEELSESWHFQQGLLYAPKVVTAMVIFNVLDSVFTDFDYFQLKLEYLDDILRILNSN